MKNKIVMEVGSYKFAILDPTPENLAIASALANVPLYESNGEWDAKKLVYRQVADASVKVEIKPVRVSNEDDVFVEAARAARADADTKRYTAEAAKTTAERERDAMKVQRDEAIAAATRVKELEAEKAAALDELAKIKAAMVEAGVSVSYEN